MNPTLRTTLDVKNQISHVLVKTFNVCPNRALVNDFFEFRVSPGAGATKTSERLFKMYKKWQEELFVTLWMIFILGSPSHTLKSFDFFPVPICHGKLCPPLYTTPELVKGRKSFFGFSSK